MFDTIASLSHRASARPAGHTGHAGHTGLASHLHIAPQPLSGSAPVAPAPLRLHDGELSQWLVQMLDEIDYGMLLVAGDSQVLYLNHMARHELDSQHPLQLLGRSLRAGQSQDLAPLHDALAAAQRGLRRLLTLGQGEHRVSVSVVPLPDSAAAPERGRITLLVLGKRQVCQRLSVHGFARSVALTPAETRVLEQLCGGVKPTEVAALQGVAVSTVRTQIGSIRAKTGAASIRDLVRQVAVLPPLVGALRAVGGGAAVGMGLALP